MIIFRCNHLASFRIAGSADSIQLANLRWDMRIESGEASFVSKAEFISSCASFFQAGTDSGSHFHWVADIDEMIVAVASIHVVDMTPRPCKLEDQFGYLTNVYTVPKLRNQGIGSALLRRAKSWACDNDLELLIVWPGEGAEGHYEKMGFQRDQEIMTVGLRSYN
jgi:GNAT superfamily N-acetyltransferase